MASEDITASGMEASAWAAGVLLLFLAASVPLLFGAWDSRATKADAVYLALCIPPGLMFDVMVYERDATTRSLAVFRMGLFSLLTTYALGLLPLLAVWRRRRVRLEEALALSAAPPVPP